MASEPVVAAPPADAPIDDGDVVDPWNVKASESGGIDYNKLIEKFGSSRIEPVHIMRETACHLCVAHIYQSVCAAVN